MNHMRELRCGQANLFILYLISGDSEILSQQRAFIKKTGSWYEVKYFPRLSLTFSSLGTLRPLVLFCPIKCFYVLIICVNQWFSSEGSVVPRGHLTICGDILYFHSQGGASGRSKPKMLLNKRRILWPKMSAVPRLRNPGVELKYEA